MSEFRRRLMMRSREAQDEVVFKEGFLFAGNHNFDISRNSVLKSFRLELDGLSLFESGGAAYFEVGSFWDNTRIVNFNFKYISTKSVEVNFGDYYSKYIQIYSYYKVTLTYKYRGEANGTWTGDLFFEVLSSAGEILLSRESPYNTTYMPEGLDCLIINLEGASTSLSSSKVIKIS